MQKGFALDQVSQEDKRATSATTKPKERKVQSNSVTEQLRCAQAEQDLYKAEAEKYRYDAVCATLAIIQTFEQIADDQHVPMNPTVKGAANYLEKHIMNSSSPSAGPSSFQGRAKAPQ